VAAGFFECGTSFSLWGKFPHCDGRNTYCGSRSIRPLRLPIMGVEFYTFWVLHTTFWAYLLGPRRVLICCTNLSLCRSLYYEKGLLGLLTARLARRSTHFMKIIYVEDSRVLLGVFKHQHLYFCKRDLRTPARVIM
jgi:hypothetical protein